MKIILYVMQCNILLLAVLYVEASDKNLIITPSFRRFYYKIINFHQRDYAYLGEKECCGGNSRIEGNCSTPCARYVKVTLQDSVSFRRDIRAENSEPGGAFLIDVLIFNDSFTIVFESPLNLKVEIFDSSNDRIILSYSKDSIRLGQNQDIYYESEKFDENNLFNATMSFRCYGYVGYNCQYFCPYSWPEIDCEFTTGKVMCKNGKRNPPICTSENASCVPSPCLNGGACNLTQFGTMICDCPPEFDGLLCERKIITKKCDEDNTVADKDIHCNCLDGFSGLECQIAVCENYKKCGDNGVCIIENNVHHCRCKSYNYTGSFCQYECKPGCMFGGCYYNGETTLCICDNGYDGPMCDKSVPMHEIVPNVDAYTQKNMIIVGVGVGVALIVYSAIVIGIIAYLMHRHVVKNSIIHLGSSSMNDFITKLTTHKKNNNAKRL